MGLKLAIELVVKGTKALSEVSDFKSVAMSSFEKIDKSLLKLNKDGEVMDINFQKLGATLAVIGALGGKAFQSMVDASPSLQIALFMINVELENMWRSIGEELGPVIEEYLLPIFNTFSEFIQNLSPELKLFIGIFISLTVVITVLTIAIIALQAASLPLIAIILGVAAVLAILIVLWIRWKDIAIWVKVVLFALAIAVGILLSPIGLVIAGIILLMAIIKNWGAITLFFGNIWDAVTTGIGIAIENTVKWVTDGIVLIGNIIKQIGGTIADWVEKLGTGLGDGIGQGITGAIDSLDIFTEAWETFTTGIGDMWINVLDYITTAWDDFTDFFSDMGGFFGDIVTNISETITDVVKDFINTLIDALITPLNAFFEMMRTVLSALGFSEDVIAKVPTLDIKKFHEGGTYMGNEGYIQVKGGERIRTATEERALQNKLGGGTMASGVTNINLYLDNARFNDREDIDYLVSIVKDELTKDQYSRGVF